MPNLPFIAQMVNNTPSTADPITPMVNFGPASNFMPSQIPGQLGNFSSGSNFPLDVVNGGGVFRISNDGSSEGLNGNSTAKPVLYPFQQQQQATPGISVNSSEFPQFPYESLDSCSEDSLTPTGLRPPFGEAPLLSATGFRGEDGDRSLESGIETGLQVSQKRILL